MAIRSTYPDVVIPDGSLPGLLLGSLTPEEAAHPAVIDAGSGRRLTYGELATAVERLAAALAERGIGRGDVAVLAAPNCAEYPVVFHGVLRSGAAVSPANPLNTPAELAHQLRDAGARILFTTSAGLGNARAAVKEEGVRVKEIVVLDAADGVTSLDDLLAGTAAAPPEPTADDLAVLPYSSGTTGLPKGVLLTHRNVVANLSQMQPLTELRPGKRSIAVLPLFHIYGMNGIMNISLLNRATVVTMPRFDLKGFLAAVAEHRVDHLFIAPPIALALAKVPFVTDYDLGCVDVVMSAAAPLDAGIAQELAARLNVTVLQGYGLTETSPCTHGIPADRPDVDRGSIGLLMPSVEARVVDPVTGEDAERGELWVRGPNVMRGYLNNAAATAATIDSDGYLHTDDIVTVDGRGVFHVVDRLKELIKYKGFQVPPAELEALLLTHPGIADAAVIGVPDDEAGEVPKAFVVRRSAELDEAAVQAFVAERVAPYKKVRQVGFVDAIPKSAAGKILRKVLRQREVAHS
ncbi:AMP-binding protein [Amycolatopsis sp. DSM 110486]|uniref:AMP-binding protein n=1 Tax=Amycolatopsis sp. DSM 110486 TaxID=2865832 RepID=UPI001C6A0FF0|nr:AMP-binding protein [Amycolatopsis sp. DSM 110486]QYN24540.1 AMP-binding protein [Amycolatopsis sp. DSM 110486]